MSRNILTVVAAAAVALFAQGTFAQASSPSRADVKAETKAAEKNKQLTPAGEGPGAMSSGNTAGSTKTKAEGKAETKAAAKAHQLTPAGEGPGNAGTGATSGSNTSKEARKAETKAAAKSKQLTPAGEGGDAPKK
jgi:hypothetical protein